MQTCRWYQTEQALLLLMGLQINQQYQLNKIKKELKQVWEQMAILFFNNANKKDKE